LRETENKCSAAETKIKAAEEIVAHLEKQINDLTVEKDRLMDRVDTLEEGNERFFEMKEKQVGIAICGVTYRISASCENDSSAMFHL